MSEHLETSVFAPEIEAALVAAAFAAPWRIGEIYRQLDPAAHFSRPDCRFILETIDLVYRELGSSDFASIITALRESSQLEHCGGTEGVNAILAEYRYGFSSPEAEHEIFLHYIEMLKAYAIGREQKPPIPVYHFSGGKGTTTPNKLKASTRDPDETGAAIVAGKKYAVKLWRNPEFTNFRLSPTP